MANRIYLPLGSWYQDREKHDGNDIDITDLFADPEARVPWFKPNIGQSDGGGATTLQKESFRNTVMGSAKDCYVFYNDANEIVKIFEPNNLNKVSRNQLAYSDSIDLFPFDSLDVFNNTVNDCKLIDVASDVKIQGSTLETMVIKSVAGKTGLQLINYSQKGTYGVGAPNNAEIYAVGNNILFQGLTVSNGAADEQPTYFDNIGDNTSMKVCDIGSGCDFDFGGFSGAMIRRTTFQTLSGFSVKQNITGGHQVNQCVFQNDSYLDIYDNTYYAVNISNEAYIQGQKEIRYTSFGVNSQVNTTNGFIKNSIIGDNVIYNPDVDKTGINIIKLGGTVYELGVTAGAVTVTAV